MAQENAVCVIDFNYYRGIKNEILVKELAVCIPHESRQQLFIFRQAYPEENVKIETRNENKMRRNYGVHYAWDEGDIPYFRLNEILVEITSSYSKVAAYGDEKCAFVEKIIQRNVFNMHPGFDEFQNSAIAQVLVFNTCCLKHHNENRKECALAKCLRFASYMMNFMTIQAKVFENDVEMTDLSDCVVNNNKKHVRFLLPESAV
jgi:hypothetical protein